MYSTWHISVLFNPAISWVADPIFWPRWFAERSTLYFKKYWKNIFLCNKNDLSFLKCKLHDLHQMKQGKIFYRSYLILQLSRIGQGFCTLITGSFTSVTFFRWHWKTIGFNSGLGRSVLCPFLWWKSLRLPTFIHNICHPKSKGTLQCCCVVFAFHAVYDASLEQFLK